jgi:cold shock CspA family protein
MRFKKYEVSVVQSATRLEIEEDGLIPEIEVGPSTLNIEIPKDDFSEQVLVFMRDGQKNVYKLGIKRENGERWEYWINVPILFSDYYRYPVPHRYPANTLRVATMNPAGIVEISEIAIVAQKAGMFVTVQHRDSVQAHEGPNGTMCFPHFVVDNWPAMETLLVENFKKPRSTLPAELTFEAAESPQYNDIPQFCGIVEWWNYAMQLGCVQCFDGTPVRVHHSEITRDDNSRRIFLLPGEVVTWEHMREIPKDGALRRKTDFNYELINVSIVRD